MRHVKLADESFLISPSPPPAKSYLNRQEIIDVVLLEAKVQAIHPGYRFLSEDAKFASLCQQKEIIFIGPPPQAISVMGDKREAKQLIEKAGVPVVPGYKDTFQDLNILRRSKL